MKTKAQKNEIIEKLGQEIEKQKSIVFIDFQGLKVKDLLTFRRQLKKVGANLRVAKKTLLQKALIAKKIPVDLKKLMGEIAAVFAFEDPIPAAKEIYKFSKTNEHVKVLGGYLDHQMYTPEILKEIANLPSKEQLLGQLVRTIASPMSGFMNVLQGNIKGLIITLQQITNNS